MSNREKYSSKTKLHSPIQAGLIDLRQRLKVTISLLDKFKTIRTFCYQYKTFFIAVLIIVIFIVVLIIYLKNANTSQRNYEVVYENIDFNVTLSSEEIIYNKVKSEQNFSDSAVDLKLPKIKVVNRSGEPGLGAKTRLKLEANNYEVINLSAEFTSPQAKTVIVYNFKNENEALKISALLDNALPSVTDIEDLQDVITVYVGSDIKNE